jgi:hypothetical protein
MVDVDTFLTTLYVIVDDFCQSHPPKHRRPGPDASLSSGEVVTLAIFSRWSRFTSERDFYRYATRYRVCDAFPTLPHRSQFNRLVRAHLDLIEAVALHLAEMMEAQSSVPTKHCTALLCPSETPSGGVVDGWPAAPTSDGAIAWDGTRRLPSAYGRQPCGSHNWLWLLCCFYHGPTGS